VVGFAVLALQIFLGGWTSTNYAAVACPDLPTCQRSFWPAMDFKDAFVLWRGLGIDYDTVGFIAVLPQVRELNIGHFLIGEAIFVGLAHSVKAMRMAMDEGRAGAAR